MSFEVSALVYRKPSNQKTKTRSYKIPDWDGRCLSCGKDNGEVSFGKGASGVCNRCSKQKWEAANPVKLRAQRLHGNAQKRAKKQGWVPPDFSSLWIEEKIRAGYCEVTGIPFDLETVTADTHAPNPFVPSLDRVDSSGIYSKENVRLVIYMYNVCKAEFSHDDVVSFCRQVATRSAVHGIQN